MFIFLNFDNENSRSWMKITASVKNLLHPYNNLNEDKVIKIWDEWSKNKTTYNKDKKKYGMLYH